uniref:Non-haem dioxygenase N-terminal domain-containing protein n=1 Tax=Vitis vinifera TaxID=29760 RepID=A5B2B5_VITVI|nr:hypothetical protein VITISV_013422 [Vitis vinifera]
MVGEEMSKELESSLPVENVQALASNNPLVDESLQIPIIDMRKLMVEDDEMGKLHLACKEWGFFQICSRTEGLGYGFPWNPKVEQRDSFCRSSNYLIINKNWEVMANSLGFKGLTSDPTYDLI